MRFRWHRGSLVDSLATMSEWDTVADLIAIVGRADFVVEPYGIGIDPRTGWDTHVLRVPGVGVLGFTDGPLP